MSAVGLRGTERGDVGKTNARIAEGTLLGSFGSQLGGALKGHAMMGPQDPDPQRSATIPRYKLAVIIWLAIYPALTATLAVLGPVITPWPLFLRTLL